MLTLWAVQWGDKYPDQYVHNLRRSLRRRLAGDYSFRVLSDRDIPGVDCVRTDQKWIGWWQKLLLFRYDAPGLNVYVDLDSVIVGDLAAMIAAHECDHIAMPKNWAQSGHDSCQSSVMIWQGAHCRDLLDGFSFTDASKRLWGDQEWITERYGKPGEGVVVPIEHPWVVSYKYHCQNGVPKGAAVVTFHGEPKPHQVDDAWIKANWW